MDIREELLYHVWKNRLFEKPLLDLDDDEVDLIDPGQRNRDAGPDFINARIRSGSILWAGNIEIHRKASEWYQHRHHLNPSYNNVILHVVTEPDCCVVTSRGRPVRTARMLIPPAVKRRYYLLMEDPDLIPCWRCLKHINGPGMKRWIEQLGSERIEFRMKKIMAELKESDTDWNTILFLSVARAFGQNVNADPFEMLARSLPLSRIRDYCPDIISTEALLYGQAGMLEQAPGGDPDKYFSDLNRIYFSLNRKLKLKPLDLYLWRFLRLRPHNFPTIRISQLASLLHKHPNLFEDFISRGDPHEFVFNLGINASEYWSSHYRFGQESPNITKAIGRGRLNGLLINAFLPVRFSYYLYTAKPISAWKESMMGLKPENNRIIRMWKSIGIEVPDALYSQALIQLTNNYCKFRRCLSCYVGNQIILSSPEKK